MQIGALRPHLAEAGTGFPVGRHFHQFLHCVLHSLSLGIDCLCHRERWRALLSHAFLDHITFLELTFRPHYCFDDICFLDVVVLDGRLQLRRTSDRYSKYTAAMKCPK